MSVNSFLNLKSTTYDPLSLLFSQLRSLHTAPPLHHGNTNWRPRKLLVTKQHSGESSYLGDMTITLGRWSDIRMWHPSQFSPTNSRNSGASLVIVCPCWKLLRALSYNRDQWNGCCGRRFAWWPELEVTTKTTLSYNRDQRHGCCGRRCVHFCSGLDTKIHLEN